MDEYRPDLVLVSAGFDSRAGDPLGNFLLTDSDFPDLTHVLMEIADKYAHGRLISVLEGGYDLHGLEKAVHAHAHALSGSAKQLIPAIPAAPRLNARACIHLRDSAAVPGIGMRVSAQRAADRLRRFYPGAAPANPLRAA